MRPSPVGPGHAEMRPGPYGGGSFREDREGFSSQPPGDSSAALGHRTFPGKGKQALHRPHAMKFKVTRNPSAAKLLEIDSSDGCSMLQA